MLKKILTVFIGFILSSTIHSQVVVLERVAELMNEMYTIEGDAYLEELDNGVLQLRLSEDFATPFGPDVRIYLNNSISATGGIEIVNLSDINHFNGALTVEVPLGVDIDDYQYIVFFCFQFQQLWASGEWSDSGPPDGGFVCEDSDVTLSNGTATIDICPSDSESDVLTFTNTLNLPATTHYAYLLTDENQILQQAIIGDNFNFEGSSIDEQRVYGIHYDGNLEPAIGSNRSATSATGCFTHSSNLEYVEITKNACPSYECFLSNTFTTNGTTLIDICSSDGNSDIVPLLNSINENPGEHYAFLITDQNQLLQEVVYSSSYNFEGTSDSEQRVYGVHFDGNLNPIFGSSRLQTSASGCFTHSNNNNYITVTKEACPPDFICESNNTGSSTGNSISICPSDGTSDLIDFTNSINAEVGTHYAYLITDESEILQEVVLQSSFNFEGSTDETQRVYGIHFDGNLIPDLGQPRTNTVASGCFQHSDNDIFVTVIKDSCPPVFICLTTTISTDNSENTIDICPSDDNSDIISFQNNQSIEGGLHFAYLITDMNENVIAYTQTNNYDFEGSSDQEERVYGVHFDGDLDVVLGQNRLQTTATECYEHSSATIYLTVTKNACPPAYECASSLTATTDWATEIDICPTDGDSDIIELRNNIMEPVGEHYVYLITDSDEILQEVVFDSLYDFEGSELIEQRVYGINYDGDLDIKLGENRLETEATGCFIHSGSNLFLTINKTACVSDFECVESLTASTAWVTNIDICANDGIADEILIQNNISTEPGEHYAFLLTDTSEILLEVFFDSIYNFEGLEDPQYRVYGVSYSGQLEPAVGEVRQNTTATDCYIHSGGNLFITINTQAECIVATEDVDVNDLVNIYPNPSQGFLNIEYADKSEITNSTIYNSQGRKVMEGINSNWFKIETPGIYILQISTQNKKYTKRFVVTR